MRGLWLCLWVLAWAGCGGEGDLPSQASGELPARDRGDGGDDEAHEGGDGAHEEQDASDDPSVDLGDAGHSADDAGDVNDTAQDARGDAGQDAGQDVREDAGQDVGQDVREDVGQDAGQDAGQDVSQDVREDVGQDAGQDVGQDAGQDAPPEVCEEVWGRVGTSPAPHQFTLGGQRAWFHDEGHVYGYFHTYDNLALCGQAARQVHVLLPRRYESRAQRFPVVYVNDGQTTFWPNGASGKTWDAAALLSRLSPCELEPVILVAVHPLDRNREYTHTPWSDDRTCCEVEAYADYLADCVKPFVDANYHTDPAAERTTVLGASHGGLASFLTASLRRDAFGNAIAMSSSFWVGVDYNRAWSGEPLEDSALLSLAGPRLAPGSPRPWLWLDWGLRRDGGPHNAVTEDLATRRGEQMVQILERDFAYTQGQDLHVLVDPDGEHDERSWARHLPTPLRLLYGR